MADISTIYMGMRLASPVIVGASTFSTHLDSIKRAEQAGAGAMVIHSLFQEEIEMERMELDAELTTGADVYGESLTYLPQLEHAGAREHVMWIEEARKQVKFPLIGSLNARSVGQWVRYARELENAGCDALELNLYSVETNPEVTADHIETRAQDTVAAVKSEVNIPVAVKLSPWYTSIANFIARVAQAGADSVVLFNRFYQPTINPEKEELEISLDLSRPEDTRLPLRWIAILSSQIPTEFAASTGVYSGKDVVRHILAGARAAQTVSALRTRGLDHIKDMNRDIEEWMESKGYSRIDSFRGKLNQKNIEGDPYAFERAQYIKILMGQKI